MKLQTYTTMEVAKLFQRVDVLTRVNASLREQLRQCQEGQGGVGAQQ